MMCKQNIFHVGPCLLAYMCQLGRLLCLQIDIISMGNLCFLVCDVDFKLAKQKKLSSYTFGTAYIIYIKLMAQVKNHCKLDFLADSVYLNILLDEFHAYARMS